MFINLTALTTTAFKGYPRFYTLEEVQRLFQQRRVVLREMTLRSSLYFQFSNAIGVDVF